MRARQLGQGQGYEGTTAATRYELFDWSRRKSARLGWDSPSSDFFADLVPPG